MTFAITKYNYPLESEIIFSESLNLKFDNPRTKEEIKIVREYIAETIEHNQNDKNSSLAPLGVRLGLSILELQTHKKKVDKSSYVLKYYEAGGDKTYLDILAESWIILRFPFEEEFSQIVSDRRILFDLILSKKNSSYASEFKKIASYCQLISLLSNNEEDDYSGQSFLLSENQYDIFFSKNNINVHFALETFISSNFSLRDADLHGKNWMYWPDSIEDLLISAKMLDSLIDQTNIIKPQVKISLSQKETPKQKLFHIGNLLKTASEHSKDPELILLLLVSIVEYFITRNPDTNRFNVEDSITKQFTLKCAILIHHQNKDYDLTEISLNLKNIYSQRSDLAHGNYKENYKIDDTLASVRLLYLYNKCILKAFIDDRALVEYLKDH